MFIVSDPLIRTTPNRVYRNNVLMPNELLAAYDYQYSHIIDCRATQQPSRHTCNNSLQDSRYLLLALVRNRLRFDANRLI